MSKHNAESKFLDTCEQLLLGNIVSGEGTPGPGQVHCGIIKETLRTRSCKVPSFSITTGTRKTKISPAQSWIKKGALRKMRQLVKKKLVRSMTG